MSNIDLEGHKDQRTERMKHWTRRGHLEVDCKDGLCGKSIMEDQDPISFQGFFSFRNTPHALIALQQESVPPCLHASKRVALCTDSDSN